MNNSEPWQGRSAVEREKEGETSALGSASIDSTAAQVEQGKSFDVTKALGVSFQRELVGSTMMQEEEGKGSRLPTGWINVNSDDSPATSEDSPAPSIKILSQSWFGPETCQGFFSQPTSGQGVPE